MQKTPAQLFKRWGEEKGADKYAKATKPVSDSATTLQHYCCCCLSYMGSLSISLSLFLSTWLALQNNNKNNVSSSSNSATLQMKRKFTNSIHEILLRWPTSTLTPPSSSLWSSAPPSCWSSTSMQSHTQSADRNEWERERERREQRRALWIVRFATCFCASRRVASALSKAAQSPTACWLCSGVGVCVWRLLSFGTCRMFCCCCETFYMPALCLPLFCFAQQNPWKMSKEGYCASWNNLRLWPA